MIEFTAGLLVGAVAGALIGGVWLWRIVNRAIDSFERPPADDEPGGGWQW